LYAGSEPLCVCPSSTKLSFKKRLAVVSNSTEEINASSADFFIAEKSIALSAIFALIETKACPVHHEFQQMKTAQG
jgi:hypothetical protein